MTRDEIINGLEREVKSIRRKPQGKMLGIFMTVDEAEEIITMLKEQEAVPPIKQYDGNPGDWASWWYVCGNCERDIDCYDKFCRSCGMAVKWDD